MKRIIFLITLFSILTYNSQASAVSMNLGFWTGYSYSHGKYIDNLNKIFPEDVNPHRFALAMEIWAGDEIQWGFSLGFISIYDYNKKLNVVQSGDIWVQGGEQHNFELSYSSIPLMFGIRLFVFKGLYIGSLFGYHLNASKPEIDNDEYPGYGDDGLILSFLTGYDIEITRDLFIGFTFRINMGFEQKHYFTSYIPAIMVSYSL